MSDFYVGLMSGTSMDGIDAVVVSFSDRSIKIHATHSQPYSTELKDALLAAIRKPLHIELDRSGKLDQQVGECFRDAARTVINNSGVAHERIIAIGSHGQTLRHQPNAEHPFSLQIGSAKVIAAGTNIKTVANFRAADIAVGGQGAPLTPAFHQWLFGSDNCDRVIANIGGIGNITVLSSDRTDVTGFDTGPGNGLMDAWISSHRGESFDQGGKWAACGKVINSLLEAFQGDPYFKLQPPKSTGFEYFNRKWLDAFGVDRFEPVDVQATLCELTAATIAAAVNAHADTASDVFVCGGGVHNIELMRRLTENLGAASVVSTLAAGLDPDWVEAAAFAWLAMRTINGQSGNLPSVTGASHKVILGEIHCPGS